MTSRVDVFTPKNSQNEEQNKFGAINDEYVLQYLYENPNFFIRNAAGVENLKVPHPVKGVISLPEWQMGRQRNKIQQLESELTLLMEHAVNNEKLFNQFMDVQNQLIACQNLTELMDCLNKWSKSLGLQGAYLYLFDDKWQLDIPLDYQKFRLNADSFNFIRVRHLQYSRQYLGTLNSTELDFLLPDRNYVGSVAMSLLGQFGDLGVLIFTSNNSKHYQVGQGTLLIERISDLLPILINKWLMRTK